MSKAYDPENPRCDIEQLTMIRDCSEKRDFTEWNEWRNANPEEEIWLQDADFRSVYCEDADFSRAHCEHALFLEADCKRACFLSAHCEGANFSGARCECAVFRDAHCEGALFQATHCEHANFLSANCEGADFSFVHCEGALFLKAYCKRAVFRDAYCKGARFSEAHCEGARFLGTHCEDARFSEAHCEGADFWDAHCEGADFFEAHCQQASFKGADCSGAKFFKTECQGTDFTSISVDHRTRFIYCEIDGETDFSNSSLASMIVEPGVRAKLEQNIRRKNWKEWYGPSWWRKFYTFPVRVFWWISNYGYSTTRMFFVFLAAVSFFAALYTVLPTYLEIGDKSLPTIGMPSWCTVDLICHREYANPLQMFFFALSTMVTLGFSNINVAVDGADQASIMGTIIVSFNLMTGYFLLAVLVTRLSVLFQTLAPGWHPAKPEGKKK